MSVRSSTSVPTTCSGAMYPTVPSTTPGTVKCCVSESLDLIFGDAEIEQLHLSLTVLVLGDEDVPGLEIAVDHPQAVGRLEPFEHRVQPLGDALGLDRPRALQTRA